MTPSFDARRTTSASAPPRARGHAGALAQLAAALVVGSAVASAAGACSSGGTDGTTEPDSGNDGSSLDRAVCPKPADAPSNGAVCLLPEGTTCDFGLCGAGIARCSGGAWTYASNRPSKPFCPAIVPNPDIACPACWPAAISCPYGSTDCSLADASINRAVASCPHGTWVIDIRPCRDGGGPDVQGDGEPDAD